MLRGLRNETFALFFIAALFFTVWSILLWQISAEKQQKADTAEYGTQGSNNWPTDQDCIAKPDFASVKQCIENQIEARRDTKRSEYDLAAQQEIAYWTPWAFLGSLVTVFVSLVGVIYVRDTLLETRRIGEAQTRAYVSVFDFETIIRDDPDPCISVKVIVKNTGQSPARDLRVNWTWASHEPPFKEERHQYEISESEGKGSISAGMTAYFLIATNQFKETNKRLNRNEIELILKGERKFWIFGIIEYYDVFGRHHRTRFRYEMSLQQEQPVFSPCLSGNEES